jgi:hypothetical protein
MLVPSTKSGVCCGDGVPEPAFWRIFQIVKAKEF